MGEDVTTQKRSGGMEPGFLGWLRWTVSPCEHQWNHTRIYGDARLYLGRHEEWVCSRCGRVRGKNPAPTGERGRR
jgi:hypothetical protein